MGGDQETEGQGDADSHGAPHCTAWAGTGVLLGLSGGVPHALGLVGDALAATPIGRDMPADPDGLDADLHPHMTGGIVVTP